MWLEEQCPSHTHLWKHGRYGLNGVERALKGIGQKLQSVRYCSSFLSNTFAVWLFRCQPWCSVEVCCSVMCCDFVHLWSSFGIVWFAAAVLSRRCLRKEGRPLSMKFKGCIFAQWERQDGKRTVHTSVFSMCLCVCLPHPCRSLHAGGWRHCSRDLPHLHWNRLQETQRRPQEADAAGLCGRQRLEEELAGRNDVTSLPRSFVLLQGGPSLGATQPAKPPPRVIWLKSNQLKSSSADRKCQTKCWDHARSSGRSVFQRPMACLCVPAGKSGGLWKSSGGWDPLFSM